MTAVAKGSWGAILLGCIRMMKIIILHAKSAHL